MSAMSIKFFFFNLCFVYVSYIVGQFLYQASRVGKQEFLQTQRYSDRVLFCTPLRDAEAHLPRFFSGLYNLSYPHELVDIAFLVSESKDQTTSALVSYIDRLQKSADKKMPYHSVSVLHKDFHQIVAQDARSRHDFIAQPERRKKLAKARNWLWSALLRPHHAWVYWQDVDVERIPATIFEDLMKHDSDVIVPSVWMTHSKYGDFPYDLNSWIESDQGRAVSAALPEDTMAKAMGFQVRGLPHYTVWHAYEEGL
ncbi:mannan polymerase II complex ANP1 subunit [Pyrenophora seminiperda CCB06]|uniref:Mannan polymerase II complex ANP1 subunit n=1 Tax=Pyrenophora seminiperda CCB06 TaxID=1302712 RepID=A0A3M7MF53_9PLEO|nr:mannan polymerase II complex ANP1 subunit [Pyrenophora seminiperda CCB06]